MVNFIIFNFCCPLNSLNTLLKGFSLGDKAVKMGLGIFFFSGTCLVNGRITEIIVNGVQHYKG